MAGHSAKTISLTDLMAAVARVVCAADACEIHGHAALDGPAVDEAFIWEGGSAMNPKSPYLTYGELRRLKTEWAKVRSALDGVQ